MTVSTMTLSPLLEKERNGFPRSPLQPWRKVKVAKVTINLGAGKNEELLQRGIKLLQKMTPLRPVKTFTRKRIPGWGLRPGLAIGAKVTVRKEAPAFLLRLLEAKGKVLSSDNFDERGNFSFGIPEYIDIPGLEYDPELKIIGLEAAVTLERPGYRVKWRKIRPGKIGKRQQIGKAEAIQFVQGLGVRVQ